MACLACTRAALYLSMSSFYLSRKSVLHSARSSSSSSFTQITQQPFIYKGRALRSGTVGNTTESQVRVSVQCLHTRAPPSQVYILCLHSLMFTLQRRCSSCSVSNICISQLQLAYKQYEMNIITYSLELCVWILPWGTGPVNEDMKNKIRIHSFTQSAFTITHNNNQLSEFLRKFLGV